MCQHCLYIPNHRVERVMPANKKTIAGMARSYNTRRYAL
jgi:hypothetical protein